MQNPYQSPVTELSGPDLAGAAGMHVDGKYLVVRSPVRLAPYCVKSGVPIAPEDYNSKTLSWCSPLYAIFVVFGLLPYLILYMVAKKDCAISYGLSREVRRRYRNRLLIKIAIAVVSFVAISLTSLSSIAVTITIIVFIAAIVSFFIGQSPLSIAKFKRGEFWIAGCSSDFLARHDR